MSTLLYFQNDIAASTVTAGGYTFSWIHILIALAAVFILFKLIAFQLEMMMKLVIAVLVVAAAVYFIYYK